MGADFTTDRLAQGAGLDLPASSAPKGCRQRASEATDWLTPLRRISQAHWEVGATHRREGTLTYRTRPVGPRSTRRTDRTRGLGRRAERHVARQFGQSTSHRRCKASRLRSASPRPAAVAVHPLIAAHRSRCNNRKEFLHSWRFRRNLQTQRMACSSHHIRATTERWSMGGCNLDSERFFDVVVRICLDGGWIWEGAHNRPFITLDHRTVRAALRAAAAVRP